MAEKTMIPKTLVKEIKKLKLLHLQHDVYALLFATETPPQSMRCISLVR